MQTFTMTELLRTPKQVAAAVDVHGPAVIARRDGPDLVLVDADAYAHQARGIAVASQYLRATLDQGDRADALRRCMTWTSVLTDDELDGFIADMDHLAWAATDLGQYTQLLRTYEGWRGTADAYAAGMPRNSDDLTPIDEPVHRP